MTRRCDDHSFGPASCLRELDFTLEFRARHLVYPSSCPFSCWQSPYDWFSYQEGRKRRLAMASARSSWFVRPSAEALRPANKEFHQLAASFNIVFQLALVTLWSLPHVRSTPTSVPSAAMSTLTAPGILGLSYLEDRRSVRASTLLTICLVPSIIFDAIQIELCGSLAERIGPG